MTTTPTCVVCGTRNATTPRVCDFCRSKVAQALAGIPNLVEIAEGELLPGSSGGGRGTERGLGLRVAALDLVAGNTVLPMLEEWERTVRADYGLARYGPASVHRSPSKGSLMFALYRGSCAFLAAWWGRIADDHDGAAAFAADVVDGYRTAMAAANALPRTTWAVSCPAEEPDSDGPCGRVLRVTGEDVGHVVVCRACGTHWDVERLLLVVAADSEADVWLPPEDVTRLLGTPESTLREWARKGRIARDHGRYEVASVRAAMTDWTPRARSSA